MRHLALVDPGDAEDVVDDLLLVDRGAQFGERLLVVAIEVPDLLFLARELARAARSGPASSPRRRPSRRPSCRPRRAEGRGARAARRSCGSRRAPPLRSCSRRRSCGPAAFCSCIDLRPDAVELLVRRGPRAIRRCSASSSVSSRLRLSGRARRGRILRRAIVQLLLQVVDVLRTPGPWRIRRRGRRARGAATALTVTSNSPVLPASCRIA